MASDLLEESLIFVFFSVVDFSDESRDIDIRTLGFHSRGLRRSGRTQIKLNLNLQVEFEYTRDWRGSQDI